MTLPVSVIMPVKNGARFIGEALGSVLDENVAEVIVVDDLSGDETLELMESFERTNRGVVKIFETGKAGGVGVARNLGLSKATQPWVALIDADDVWLPGKTRKQLLALEQEELNTGRVGWAYAYSRVEHFLSDGYEIPETLRADKLGEIDLFFPLNLLCRRSVFALVGGFDPDLVCANDVDWYHRAQKLGVERVQVPEVLVRKRVHDQNLSLCQGHDMQRQIFSVLKRKVTPNMFPVFK